jgi:Mannosyltransferase putative
MTPLPVCRWRKESFKGQFLCHSAKFCDPPNPVSAAFCRKCSYADHDPPALLPQPLPCVHLGERVAGGSGDSRRGGRVSRDRFVCFLHRFCTVEAADQRRPTEERSCATCLDYLPRDPFGPNSDQMLRQAEAFLTALPAYPKERYQGRGVVIAGGGDRFFPSLYVTVRALRHVGCRLPIQVWYLGRNDEMPAGQEALLAPLEVECVDADKVRRRYPARRLSGWELKVFATLHSPFEELLFLDADCYPCRNPEFLFELAEYRARGAIFWPDTVADDPLLAWSAFGVPDPRRLGSVESGQFVVHKKLCWEPLNLAWFYNDHSDYYYRYGFGDKHTFEVAWTRCARPFVMWEPKATWVEVAYVHRGPDLKPLFVHRCCDKFRFAGHAYNTMQFHPLPLFHASLPLEQECWRWMSELARLTGHLVYA